VIHSLGVSGATVLNTNTNANAWRREHLHRHFRKGSAHDPRADARIGLPVEVKLKTNAFNFGVSVRADSPTCWRASRSRVMTAARFNSAWSTTLQPPDAREGRKVEFNEGARDVQTWRRSTDHQLRQRSRNEFRQHNLIWGSQQPSWVNSDAAESDSVRSSLDKVNSPPCGRDQRTDSVRRRRSRRQLFGH